MVVSAQVDVLGILGQLAQALLNLVCSIPLLGFLAQFLISAAVALIDGLTPGLLPQVFGLLRLDLVPCTIELGMLGTFLSGLVGNILSILGTGLGGSVTVGRSGTYSEVKENLQTLKDLIATSGLFDPKEIQATEKELDHLLQIFN